MGMQVLRFYCFFSESVPESPVESERVRPCILYFYLEDDSMHLADVKVINSGLPSGVFLKRHRVPKSSTEFVSFALLLESVSLVMECLCLPRLFKKL